MPLDELDPEAAWVYRVAVARLVEQARSCETVGRRLDADGRGDIARFWWERADVMWLNAVIALLEDRPAR